ncbi:hypothetical protein Tco_0094644, partial [Tanacetum coccineum]
MRDAWNLGNKDGSRTGQKEDSKALRERLSDASIKIKAYSQVLKKVEAQLVAHQQGQLCYYDPSCISTEDSYWMITKRGKRLQRYDLQLIMCGDMSRILILILSQGEALKLPILKKGEYDIWAMKMEHYLAHTDYP